MIERSRDVPTPLPCSLALELEMPGMEEIEGGNEQQESSTSVLYIVGTNRTRIACGTAEKKRPLCVCSFGPTMISYFRADPAGDRAQRLVFPRKYYRSSSLWRVTKAVSVPRFTPRIRAMALCDTRFVSSSRMTSSFPVSFVSLA